MNRDQIMGGFKDTAGRIQRKLGQLVGSRRQEAKGAGTQAEGKTQGAVGDASDAFEKTTETVKNVSRR